MKEEYVKPTKIGKKQTQGGNDKNKEEIELPTIDDLIKGIDQGIKKAKNYVHKNIAKPCETC